MKQGIIPGFITGKDSMALLRHVFDNFIIVVDGNFTPWSNWSQCSKSCGGGQRKRTRSCSNPPPSRCGKTCVGDNEEVANCNTQACPGKDDVLRNWQGFNPCKYAMFGSLDHEALCSSPVLSRQHHKCLCFKGNLHSKLTLNC